MFGNLSKHLIKAPHYFNNNIDTEPNQYSKLSDEYLLDTFSNLRKLNTRSNNSRYFKERDFVKKNFKLDLNYNNNFRKEITPQVKTKPCISFEEFISGKSNICSRNNSTIVTKQSLYKTNKSNKLNITNLSNLNKSVDSKKTYFYNKDEKLQNILEKKIKPVEEFNEEMKTNLYNLIGKISKNSLKFNEFNSQKKKNQKNRIENLKEFINKNTVVEPPIKIKFPDINIKSNDTLYREAMDKKISSLSTVNPKIIEQLKSKNRVSASRQDFYRYNNSYALYKQNPFSQSVKYIEENKKKDLLDN